MLGDRIGRNGEAFSRTIIDQFHMLVKGSASLGRYLAPFVKTDGVQHLYAGTKSIRVNALQPFLPIGLDGVKEARSVGVGC